MKQPPSHRDSFASYGVSSWQGKQTATERTDLRTTRLGADYRFFCSRWDGNRRPSRRSWTEATLRPNLRLIAASDAVPSNLSSAGVQLRCADRSTAGLIPNLSRPQYMKPLESPDIHHLQAAIGWLELGRHIDANEELEKITARLRAHPDVLKVRWRVYAMAKRWDACFEIARAITDMEPDKPGGWIDHAQSLHRLNRTPEAYDLLASAANRFPDQTTIFYHLAVYGCHLRRLREARKWLERAFEIGDAKQIKLKALEDPDLEPLWVEIGEI